MSKKIQLPAFIDYTTMTYDHLLYWRGELVWLRDRGQISMETYHLYADTLEPYFQIKRCDDKIAQLQKEIAEIEAKRDALIANLPVQENK